MRPINLAWISPSKLSEKMGALEKVDATKTHSRTKAISSECRSNGHRWNAAIFTGIGSCPAAPWPGHTFWHNRQLNVHVDQALRRADSVTSTDIREGLGKGDDIGIPFGNTRARWNKRSVLHFNANEKVPRRTKSPRSFISREKPEVELCGWVWVLVWVEEVPPRRRHRKGGVAIGVRVQAYPRSLGWTEVVAEGRGELRINGQVDK